MVYNGSNWTVVKKAMQSQYFSQEKEFIAKAVIQNLWHTMVFYNSNWFEVQKASQSQYFNERMFHG